MPTAAGATANDQGVIGFSWLDNSGTGSAKATDKAIVVAYCDELKQLSYTMQGALRSTREVEFQVPQFAGKQVHTWLAFMAAKKCSCFSLPLS